MSSKQAILVLGFGGPQSADEVRPFIESVVAGRNVPQARIDAVVEQYKLIGGKSPYVELTQKQIQCLANSLNKNGKLPNIYLGMLFGKPSIDEAVNQILTEDVEEILVIVMAPQATEISYGRYIKRLETCLAQNNPNWKDNLKINYFGSWHNHKLFIEAIVERINEVVSAEKTSYYIFTAHSIPMSTPDSALYHKLVNETASLVSSDLALAENSWFVAYQSRSGNPSEAWLEPDVLSSLEKACVQGHKNIALIPIGFIVDHVEVLYDLDVLAKAKAQELNLDVVRVKTVGDNHKFIQLLTELLTDKASLAYAH